MKRIRIGTTSEAVVCSDISIKVTVTFGVAHCRKTDTRESFFERVDRLLYERKESGLNRVMADI